jgi:hypothetical protein
MRITNKHLAILPVMLLAYFTTAGTAKNRPPSHDAAVSSETPILWSDPAGLESRDLFYGPGGSQHVPHGPFTFVKEDLDGTNPKFVVRDQDGVKWKVKLGIEARPETVASRIVWAIGYRTNEDYFLSDLRVSGMPARLHRGQKLVGPDGSMSNVRLKREGGEDKKIGTWRWRDNPFTGTRELNGLRVTMALIDNWDLKDENNAIYREDGKPVYMVSDLGASFGAPARSWPQEKGKGNLDAYSQAKFIRRVTTDTVDFQAPGRPRFVFLVNPKEYVSRIHIEWIGKNIPRADTEWMGRLLARLSQKQIGDAFRAAGYSPQEVDAFSRVLAQRISALTDL